MMLLKCKETLCTYFYIKIIHVNAVLFASHHMLVVCEEEDLHSVLKCIISEYNSKIQSQKEEKFHVE